MDSDYLITDLDFVSVNGVTFTSEERAMLHNSLTILKQDGKFIKVYFWGKISAIKGFYYVAFGVRRDILRQRQVFYCKDMKKWNLLTPPIDVHVQLHKYLRTPLIGDPSYEVEVQVPTYYFDNETEMEDESVVSEQSEEGNEEEIEEIDYLGNKSSSKTNFESATPTEDDDEAADLTIMSEEDRLTCLIQKITTEAALAPRGAFVRTPIGEVLPNSFFSGLNAIEAMKPHNYVHVRFPRREISKFRTGCSEVTRSIDFMDVISDDMPKGCWSIQMDTTRDIVILRSLWWPGMVFYHRINTRDFGFLYNGSGDKCVDLPFMM